MHSYQIISTRKSKEVGSTSTQEKSCPVVNSRFPPPRHFRPFLLRALSPSLLLSLFLIVKPLLRNLVKSSSGLLNGLRNHIRSVRALLRPPFGRRLLLGRNEKPLVHLHVDNVRPLGRIATHTPTDQIIGERVNFTMQSRSVRSNTMVRFLLDGWIASEDDSEEDA